MSGKYRFGPRAADSGYTQLPNVVLYDEALSASARLLYAMFWDLAAFSQDEPEQDELAVKMSCTAKTVRGYITELEEAGLVESKRRGQGLTNAYVVNVPNGKNDRGRTVEMTEPTVLTEDEKQDQDTAANAAGLAVDDARRIYEHWRAARGKTRATYDTPSSARLKKIRTRMLEFEVEELLRAIDGVAFDPWPERHLHDDLTIIFRSHEQVDKFLELEARRPVAAGGLTATQAATMDLGLDG